MSLLAQGARGASAYTLADNYTTRPLAKSIQFSTNAGDTPRRVWSQVIDELLVIRTLPEGWDGQGAEAPHPAVVDGAIRFAQCFHADRLMPADRVLAGVNGTVFFEWFTATGYTEIEVTGPDQAEGRFVPKGATTATVFRLTGSQG